MVHDVRNGEQEMGVRACQRELVA